MSSFYRRSSVPARFARGCLRALILVVVAGALGSAAVAHGVPEVRATHAAARASTQALVDLAARFRAASPAARPGLEGELVAAAAARHAYLVSVVTDDPAGVIDASLSTAQRSRLPALLAPYLEQEAELDGTLEILHEDRLDGARFHYRLHTSRGRFTLHFAAHPPEHLATGATVRVRGVQLDDKLALADGATSVQQVAGGSIPASLGAQRTAVVLVNFTDNPSQPYSIADAQAALFGTTSAYFFENSYSQAWLTGDVFGWFTIAVSSTACDYDAIANAAKSAATAAGIDLSSYAHQVYAFPQNACGWWGLSSVGGVPSQSWINGAFELGVLAHELGHGQGLWHSHSLDCGTTAIVGPSCATNEYGDIIDMMGSSQAAHFNAFQKERLGWLNSGASPPITTVQADGTYTIEPYESPGTGPKALKVLKSTDPSTGQRTWYYVESRQALGFDAFLAGPSVGPQNVTSGVLVHLGTEGNGNTGSLLDMTPATVMYYWWYDPALVAGETFIDPDTGLSITTSWVSAAGAGVTIKVGKTASNSPTVAVTTDHTNYTRGQTASITAKVTFAGSPVGKAPVSFAIIKSNGATVTASATTGSSGTAVFKLRIGKSDPVGQYQIDATATVGGLSGAGATTFVVQ